MSDQVTNTSAVSEEIKMRVLEMAPPSSAPPSDKLLSRIAILLFILVAGLLTVFGFYASSICITVILAGFLAILFDPVVVILEKLHLPRSVAAAGIVFAGMSLVGLLGYVFYGKAVTFAEELPVYASKVQQTIERPRGGTSDGRVLGGSRSDVVQGLYGHHPGGIEGHD